MRICQVAPCFPYKEHLEGGIVEQNYHIGGVERHIYELSKALARQGHVITIITTRSPKHDLYHETDGLNILRVPYGIPLYSSSIPLAILRRLNTEDYDIIHAHTPNPMIADLACMANRVRLPFILTYHNDITSGGRVGSLVSKIYNMTAGKYLLDKADVIIATTCGYAKHSTLLCNHLGKVRAIPNGINPDMFNVCPGGPDIRAKYGIPRDAKVILFIGALAEYKGVNYLIQAFEKLNRSCQGAFLVIVGSGYMRNPLEEQAKNTGLSGRVIFTGYVGDKEMPYFYSMSDIFVLPSVSEKEGFGIVQLEAMASGKPVISSNLPGVRDVDPDEIATLHVAPGDAAGLADAMLRLLSNPDLARCMGERGKALVSERYTWDIVAKTAERTYEEALK